MSMSLNLVKTMKAKFASPCEGRLRNGERGPLCDGVNVGDTILYQRKEYSANFGGTSHFTLVGHLDCLFNAHMSNVDNPRMKQIHFSATDKFSMEELEEEWALLIGIFESNFEEEYSQNGGFTIKNGRPVV